MDRAELKDRLKEAMELNGMKQADLVSTGHFDKGQLSAWLSGRYRPKQVNIDKLSRILGVSEAWLMGYDVPRERKNSDDAENFGAYAADFNEAYRHTLKVSDEEFDVIKRYRSLDDYGKDAVDSVLESEHDRCENTIVLDENEREKILIEKHYDIGLVARRAKKGERK